jgi:glycosyltransferase involved in cell wall biosynthesis
VAATDSFVSHIAERCQGEHKIEVIKNGVDLSVFQLGSDANEIKEKFELSGKFVAAYVGTHGMAHGLGTILEAAALLRDDPRFGFLLVGDGAELARLIEQAKAMGLPNVRVAGQLPKAQMPAVWAATDASLILLRKSETFTKVLPSKMFEAMAMERPIILGVDGEAKALLEQAGAGIAIEPENAQELAAALKRLADAPAVCAKFGVQGLEHVRKHFDRAKLAVRYLEILEAAAHRRQAPELSELQRQTAS